jgi:Tfp pilus assembly protein PilV
MSRLTRALVVGVMVMAMSLATTAAVAQTHTHDENTTGEQEAAQRWNDYYQSTQVAPAELAARTRAEAMRRALTEQGNYYYHATRSAPAEHTTRTQAWERSSDSTKPTAPATAPPRPDAPIGELSWLVVTLGVLAALVAGLAVLAARFSGGGAPARPAV